ncbi:MAG: endonuclease III [Clostridia bacterium]|nr:endonuclease III [Clostridia bacterium]
MTAADISRALELLEEAYPEAKPELMYSSPFELLIATILSAQCTDARVNQCTAKLFAEHNTPESIAALSFDELADYIKPCGLYKAKGRNILATCEQLISLYGGAVPDTMEELTALPGVGRKTANVVLSNAFGRPAIAVDTHVARLANRIGFADTQDVIKIERSLNEAIPVESWSKAHHWLIYHGRRVCSARRPKCDECTLTEVCRYFKEREAD